MFYMYSLFISCFVDKIAYGQCYSVVHLEVGRALKKFLVGLSCILLLIGAKAKFLETACLIVALGKNLQCDDPNPCYQKWYKY